MGTVALAAKIGDGLEIWGGETDDLVKSNPEDNIIHGAGGDDLVFGWRGNDLITGDAGNDELRTVSTCRPSMPTQPATPTTHSPSSVRRSSAARPASCATR